MRSDDPKPPLSASPVVQPQFEIRLQASPNPAREAATVDTNLPKEGQGLFTLTNAAGVVCFTLKTDFHSGHTLLKLPLKQIKASGMLYIRLEMPYGSASTMLEISN